MIMSALSTGKGFLPNYKKSAYMSNMKKRWSNNLSETMNSMPSLQNNYRNTNTRAGNFKLQADYEPDDDFFTFAVEPDV